MNGKYFWDGGFVSLNKNGEELCGDKVEANVLSGQGTLVLADGMGSGVKANILATLTSKILCTMAANNMPIDECIRTVASTLPVCKVRHVAYSTFSMAKTTDDGKLSLIEFDNPKAIFMRGGKCIEVDREEIEISGKKIYRTERMCEDGDVVVLTSDGVPHAGIGKLLNFGWDRGEIESFLERTVESETSARGIAADLAAACNQLYMEKPGDDTTVAALRLKKRQEVDVMVGPPFDKSMDETVSTNFLNEKGMKVVCGGTTSQIIARKLGEEIRTALDYIDADIPPIGYIKGIDLVTEGVITLRRVLELSDKYLDSSATEGKSFRKKDGATLLTKLLFEKASDVKIYVGRGVNAAHSDLPIDITMKLKLVERLAGNLKKAGKNVELLYQ